jgi:hypothetical protein
MGEAFLACDRRVPIGVQSRSSPGQFLSILYSSTYPALGLSLALTGKHILSNLMQVVYVFMQICGPSAPEISTHSLQLGGNNMCAVRSGLKEV